MDAEEVVVKEEIELPEEKPDLQEIKQEQQEDNEEFNITVEDFPYICRVCCQRKSDLRPFEDEQYLLDLFHAIRKTDVRSSVEFPENICSLCVEKLEDISVFIEIFKHGDTKLEENPRPKNVFEYAGTAESGTRVYGTTEYGDSSLQSLSNCPICSSMGTMNPLEREENLAKLFKIIPNVDVKTELKLVNGSTICNPCIDKLKDISAFISFSLCGDTKLECAFGECKPIKTDFHSYTFDGNSSTEKDSNIGYNSEEKMNVHGIEEKHEVIIKKEVFDSDAEWTRPVDNPAERFKCNIRQSNFTLNNQLHSHLGSHLFDKPIADESNKRKLLTDTEKYPHECKYCEKSFQYKCRLVHHLLSHTGERPVKCDSCEKTFTRNSKLTEHMRTHTGEKPYKCDYCDKSFTCKSFLIAHLRTHTGERPYKCDQCGKTFTNIGHLKVHIGSHTGEKPYKCDCCDKSFFRKGDLKRHLLTHTGEKPYQCDICNKSFTQKSSLQTHSLIHTR